MSSEECELDGYWVPWMNGWIWMGESVDTGWIDGWILNDWILHRWIGTG